jgi:hypothetical protein
MCKTPVQFWALMICALGAAVGIVALLAPHPDSQTRIQAFTLANTLASGGIGGFTASKLLERSRSTSGNDSTEQPE